MRTVSVLLKPVSGMCNMKCEYCFYADEMINRTQASYGIMSIDTLENVIKEICSCAEERCDIAFQGGEPTLAGLDFYKKCLEFEKEYNKKQIKISHALQTNGYILNQEWCGFFAENNFLVGLSLDGIKSTHDAFRKDVEGKDTYLRTMEAVRKLEDAKADFNILTVINRKTAPKIRKIYEQYQKKGFMWQQYIACLEPIGKEPGQQPYSLEPETYGQFLIDLFHLWEMDFKQGKQPYIRQFENYIAVLMGLLPEACENCGVCSCQNVIEADGSVYPCDFYVLDEYRAGNLNKEGFETIYGSKCMENFIKESLVLSYKCKECSYYYLCRGGCRRHREQAGTEKGMNYFCKSYQMFFDACLPQLKKIADWCKWNRREWKIWNI